MLSVPQMLNLSKKSYDFCQAKYSTKQKQACKKTLPLSLKGGTTRPPQSSTSISITKIRNPEGLKNDPKSTAHTGNITKDYQDFPFQSLVHSFLKCCLWRTCCLSVYLSQNHISNTNSSSVYVFQKKKKIHPQEKHMQS